MIPLGDMMEFDTEEDERLSNELADKIIDIATDYTIEQVSSAAFSIALSAINENSVIAERQHVLSYMMTMISEEYNKTIATIRKESDVKLH